MTTDALFTPRLIKTDDFPVDPHYKVRIARADGDKDIREAHRAGHLEVQAGGYTTHWCTVALVGSEVKPRAVANLTLDLRQFEEVVRYNPADPPNDDWYAGAFKDYNARSQADFQGAKKRNLRDYTWYGMEAIRGERRANLPEISGWCDIETSSETLFVVLQEPEPGLLYGQLFMPSKYPVMQADGQTQAAMLFKLARTKIGATRRDNFRVKLEVEFGLGPGEAGQAFADRNGRGVKKNRNLVADLTSVGGMKTLMEGAIEGTIFENRIFRGRGRDGISESSTTNILDLATLELVVVNVCTHGRMKPEHFKDIHVAAYLPAVRDFLQMLERVFGYQWPEHTPKDGDAYRKVYVHGWSFSFKALSRAYYRTRIGELGPLADAMLIDDLDTVEGDKEEAWKARAKERAEEDAARDRKARKYLAPIDSKTLEDRLTKIDWVRHRKHWVTLTGYTFNSRGLPNTKKVAGEEVVKAKAPTQQEVISGFEGTLLSDNWKTLTDKTDFDWKKAGAGSKKTG